MNMKEHLEIISHRGGSGPHPEQTPEAFHYAVSRGAEAVEMDVRLNYLTRRFFLAHDFIHHPKRQWNFLEKAVREVPKSVKLVIEFKTVSVLTNIFVRTFERFYHEHLRDHNVVVISFNPFVLLRLRRIAPDIPRGIICGSRFWMFVHNWLLWRLVDAKYFVLNRRYLKLSRVEWARKRGMIIYSYLINTLKSWDQAISLEVDGVITDYPEQFMKLRSQLPGK